MSSDTQRACLLIVMEDSHAISPQHRMKFILDQIVWHITRMSFSALGKCTIFLYIAWRIPKLLLILPFPLYKYISLKARLSSIEGFAQAQTFALRQICPPPNSIVVYFQYNTSKGGCQHARSLIEELPRIVAEGRKETESILERLSSPYRLGLQTNE